MTIRRFFSEGQGGALGGRSRRRRDGERRAWRILVAVSLALAAGSVAVASPGEDDEALIRQGIESRRTHDDAAALELFRKAYDLHHSVRAVGQMGLAELALGRWVDAEKHLEEALAASGDPWVTKNRVPLKESLDRVRQHVGSLEVLGGPAGAEIIIEGVAVGTLPLAKAIRVRSGDCRFLVRAPGYEPISRSVDVPPGDLTRETVNLSKKAVPSPQTAAAEATAPRTGGPIASPPGEVAGVPPATGSNADVPSSGLPAASDSGAHLRTIGVVLGGAAVAAVATGVIFGLKARSAGQADSKSPTFDPAADSRGHRYQTLQYVGYGVGAALLAAGVTTFVLGRHQDAESAQPRVAIVPIPGGGAVSLVARF